ncbi:MAG: hypothetical protein ACYDDF_11435 [Thermoplasmatota archaeon]
MNGPAVPQRPQVRRRLRNDDEGVASAIAAILIIAALGLFILSFNVFWVPIYIENSEAGTSQAVQTSLLLWAADAEALSAQGSTGQPYSVSMPLGSTGIPYLGAGQTTGIIAINESPSAQVFLGASTTPAATAYGSLEVQTQTTRFPPQTFQYVLGGLEIDQGQSAWVNLRTMLTVQHVAPSAGNNVTLTFSAINITGGPSSAGTNGAAAVQGTLTSLVESRQAGGNVHLKITGVGGAAWRVALNRTLEAAGLTVEPWGDGVACTSSVHNFCYTPSVNTGTAVDVWVLRVQPWETHVGTVQTIIRT